LAADRHNEALARQYLLGQLSEEDAICLEEEYVADDDTFEEMEVAEDEIIDAYVRKELSRADRKRFEKLLVTAPRIRKRVEIAKMLAARASQQHIRPMEPVAEAVDRKRGVKSWSWKTVFQPSLGFRRLAFTSLALALVVGVPALFIDWLRIREESSRLSATRAELERENQKLTAQNNEYSSDRQRLSEELKKQEAENSKLNGEIEQALNRPSQPPRIPILLMISGSRASDSSNRDIRLPKEPAVFELTIVLEKASFERYSVIVKTTDERVISGPHLLRTRGKILKLRLPSTRFKPNDYIVTVSGVPPSGTPVEIEDYTFRIITNRS
jgi:hypothetical protein